MTTYIIAELQNAQSSRKGETVEAVMEIAAENGSVLSRKQDGKWIDSL